MLGGMLLGEDEVIGMSMGEIIADTLYVHIEKASRRYPGSYQMLVNQFAKAFVTPQVAYVNRRRTLAMKGCGPQSFPTILSPCWINIRSRSGSQMKKRTGNAARL